MIGELRAYSDYKPTGSKWLGDVPQHWQVQSLRSLTQSRSERNRPELTLLSVERERGVIVRDREKSSNHNYIPDDLSNYKVAKQGDLVINKSFDDSVPLKPSSLDWLGDVPEHWEVAPIKRLLSMVDYGTSQAGTDHGSVRLLTMGNIQKGEVILPKSGSLQTVAPSLLLQTGDILFTRTNGNPKLVGKTGVFRDDQNGPVTFASYLVRFRVSAPNSSTWLQRLLNSDAFWRFAQSFALVNLQTNLNSTKYCRLSIPIPLTDEQELLSNWMDEQFKPLDQKSLVLNREITLLREYRTRFIADMVTGKLDVREVARSLPADASEAAAELADRDLADEEFSEADDELADELTGEPA